MRLPRQTGILAMAGVAALLAPVAAQAATTYTVDPAAGQSCKTTGTTCASLAEAAARVNAGDGTGDTVKLAAGRYYETAAFTKRVTLEGGPGAHVLGSAGQNDSTATLSFAGTGLSALSGVRVVNLVSSAPAIASASTTGLAVRDVIAAAAKGPVVRFTDGRDNALLRTLLYAAGASADAVQISSAPTLDASAPTRALLIESSVLSGGPEGAGLRATSSGAVGQPVGDVSVTVRHATVAGAARSLVADSSQALGNPLLGTGTGNVAVTATDSILQGPTEAVAAKAGPTSAANSATVDVAGRNDVSTPAERLFRNAARRDFRLRADAPVVDQGGMSLDESRQDAVGNARVAGAASDLGALEFHNAAPVARLAVSDATPREGRAMHLNASASFDPDGPYGGGIARYRWDFGDGQSATTTTPTVAHVYTRRGHLQARVTVVDRQGGAATSEPLAVRVQDGVPPTVVIGFPAQGATVRGARYQRKRVTVVRGGKRLRVTRRVLRRAPLAFTGTVTDDSAPRSVHVALVLTRRDTRRTAGRTATRCRWFDGKRRFRTRSCRKPLWIRARLNGGSWRVRVPDSLRLPAGRYVLAARGTDTTGMTGNALGGTGAVRFTIRR